MLTDLLCARSTSKALRDVVGWPVTTDPKRMGAKSIYTGTWRSVCWIPRVWNGSAHLFWTHLTSMVEKSCNSRPAYWRAGMWHCGTWTITAVNRLALRWAGHRKWHISLWGESVDCEAVEPEWKRQQERGTWLLLCWRRSFLKKQKSKYYILHCRVLIALWGRKCFFFFACCLTAQSNECVWKRIL